VDLRRFAWLEDWVEKYEVWIQSEWTRTPVFLPLPSSLRPGYSAGHCECTYPQMEKVFFTNGSYNVCSVSWFSNFIWCTNHSKSCSHVGLEVWLAESDLHCPGWDWTFSKISGSAKPASPSSSSSPFSYLSPPHELRASCLLGGYSTIWAIPPIFFLLDIFPNRISNFCLDFTI
jgi:hypothetical protein